MAELSNGRTNSSIYVRMKDFVPCFFLEPFHFGFEELRGFALSYENTQGGRHATYDCGDVKHPSPIPYVSDELSKFRRIVTRGEVHTS